MNDFTSTVLYIKKHSITNLRYFGKTCKQDPYEYLGSGRHWLKHLRAHSKEHVDTIWVSDIFTNRDDLIEFAEFFSEFFDIVKDRSWSNQRPENGIDGAPFGSIVTNETRDKISKTNSALFNDPYWKQKNDKSRKQQGKRISEIRNSAEWKEAQYKNCLKCNALVDPANFKRWHGDKCKK